MIPARALLEEIISLKNILIIRKMQRNEPSQESSGRHEVHQKYDKPAVQDGLWKTPHCPPSDDALFGPHSSHFFTPIFENNEKAWVPKGD